MAKIDLLQLYLITLSVMQPARIQDVEQEASRLFTEDVIEGIELSSLRKIHQLARENELVISVRRGSYCVSRRGAAIIRHGSISHQIDNRRLFLMKKERRDLN